MIRQVVTAGVFCLLAGAAGADSVTTICTLQIGRQQTWVPTQVVFRRDRGSDIVLVNDPLILHFVKKPVVGRVKTENAKRITYAWELTSVQNEAGQRASRLFYRATIQKATGAVQISAIPVGFSNTFTALGHCVVK